MNRWLQRLRGALGIGALWGAAGSIVGAVGAVAANLTIGLPLLGPMIDWSLGAGFAGFLLGSGFAGLLTLSEGRRTLEELTPARAAGWGALAGAPAPTAVIVLGSAMGWNPALSAQQLIPVVLGAAGSYAALTAALAAGTVSLAKRTPDEVTSGVSSDRPRLTDAP